MVRGRRPRPVAPSTVRSLDDQFAASPKRKDCKVDPQQSPRLRPTTPASNAGSPTTAAKTPEFHGFNKSRHARAITHYFPFAQKIDGTDEDVDVDVAASIGAPSPPLSDYDENACDAFDLLAGGGATDGGILDASTNIFLQAPVLHLNIDRNAAKPAATITINKHLEVMSNFAALTATAVHCHDDDQQRCATGEHNNNNNKNNSINSHSAAKTGGNCINSHRHGGGGSVAGSETDRSDDDGHVTRSPSSVSAPESSDYVSSDSNSCDSGVVVQLQQQQQNHLQLSPSKRRKPMTPHRIVCPSPDKRTVVSKAQPTGVAVADCDDDCVLISDVEQQQQQQLQRASPAALTGLAGAGLKNPKTRRRLNAPKRTKAAAKPTSKSAAATTPAVARPPSAITVTNHSTEVITVEDDGETIRRPQTTVIAASTIDSTAFTAMPPAVTKPKDKLTDFFPVRRSVRKTKKAVEQEHLRSIEAAIRAEQEDGLVVAEFPHKGRGIMAARCFERGEFVVEYIGQLIDMPEANRREQVYAKDENTGCYMYYFKHGSQQYCIDATAESGKLGRLVNHSRNGNLVTKTVFYRNRPHLVLLAKDCIDVGEELTYDYGDRSKESLLHHPWLAL